MGSHLLQPRYCCSKAMTDRGSTPSDPPSLADQGVGTTQVIDLADIDLSGALPEEARKVVPPPLPPEEIARASQSMPPPSHPSSAPQPQVAEASRSTRFYVVVLAACLVAFVVAGAVLARSMRTDAPAPALVVSAPSAKPAAARVITISPVEMTDDVDAGSAK